MRRYDYAIVGRFSLEELLVDVTHILDQGWTPLGGLTTALVPGPLGDMRVNYLQAFIKERPLIQS